MNHESTMFDEHPNLRAKLRNSMADLRWYGYRLCELNGIKNVTPKNSLETIKKLFQTENLPPDLLKIWAWEGKIATATPEIADQLFRDTWIFVHDFDKTLRTND